MSRLVGYGTLLLRESLGRTIGEEAARTRELLPVTVAGYRRLYDFMPEHYQPAFKLSAEPIERAAANIEPAPGCSLNGLAFEVSPADIESLDGRERDYERIRVPLLAFETGEPLGEGFVYMCPPGHRLILRDPAVLLPHWRDVLFARVGSYRVSDAFGREFDATSYLADGKTPVSEFFRDHLASLLDLNSWR